MDPDTFSAYMELNAARALVETTARWARFDSANAALLDALDAALAHAADCKAAFDRLVQVEGAQVEGAVREGTCSPT